MTLDNDCPTANKRFDCYPSGTVILTQLGVINDLGAALEQ